MRKMTEKKMDAMKAKIENHIEKIENIIHENMPDNGDKCEDSQKICIIQALNELYYTTNGIKLQDFYPQED